MTPPLGDIRALLFDVFGTVVDWRGSVRGGLAAHFASRGIERDWNAFALDWRALYQPSMSAVREGRRPFTVLDVLHRESLVEVLAAHDLGDIEDAEVDALTQLWHRLDPWPDVGPALERLRGRYRLATLSNGNVALMGDVARHAALPWDAILGAEPTRHYKPDPVAYLGSAAMLVLEPAECLMVAAHNDDLDAARALGFRTAYTNRPTEYGERQSKDTGATSDWDIVCEGFGELADRLLGNARD